MTTGRDSERAPDVGRGESPGDAVGASIAREPGEGPCDATRSVSGAAVGGTGPGAGLVFDDPLDRPSSDDADRGWGDSASGTPDDDFTRFLNEKPPHHF
jgi:hypothetical protein